MATAESTRAGWPSCSRAPSIASAFMTVASIPIESARARSMPLSAPCRPRKKLPPPTTTATCTLRSAAAFRSSAMRATVGALSPNGSGPISASPESLTTTRLNRGLAVVLMKAPLRTDSQAPKLDTPPRDQPRGLTARKKRQGTKKAALTAASILAGPLGLFRRFFDPFAQREPYEPGYGDRRADRLLGLLHRLGDALGGIVDVSLIEQANLLAKGLEARLDDLLDHLRGFARVLVGEHRALACNRRRVEPGGIERDRAGGGDMHRDLPAERGQSVAAPLRLESDDDADPAEPVSDLTVHVVADRALGHPEALRPA